jgi:hypothetical protein
LPRVFLPIHGGWGRMGMTHIRLSEATEDVLAGAIRAAWRLRVEQSKKTATKQSRSTCYHVFNRVSDAFS